MVFESGVRALENWRGDLVSPMEVQGAGGKIALRRQDKVSFPFCAFLSGSLFITSTKAFPARFSECRMDLVVVGLSLGPVSGGDRVGY